MEEDSTRMFRGYKQDRIKKEIPSDVESDGRNERREKPQDLMEIMTFFNERMNKG